MLKIVNDELVNVMGEACAELNLATQPPAVVLMAGLQGSGKTTSVAKLARWLKENDKKSVLVTSADVYRPAAIEQLKTLAAAIEVDYFPSHAGENPVDIVKNAVQEGKKTFWQDCCKDHIRQMRRPLGAELKAVLLKSDFFETAPMLLSHIMKILQIDMKLQ